MTSSPFAFRSDCDIFHLPKPDNSKREHDTLPNVKLYCKHNDNGWFQSPRYYWSQTTDICQRDSISSGNTKTEESKPNFIYRRQRPIKHTVGSRPFGDPSKPSQSKGDRGSSRSDSNVQEVGKPFSRGLTEPRILWDINVRHNPGRLYPHRVHHLWRHN